MFLLKLIYNAVYFRTTSNWLDELIWCPSQCFLNFRIKDNHYILYLRWRWDDPWRAEVIVTDETYKLNNDYISLPVKWYTQDDNLAAIKFHYIKQAIITLARKR